MGVIGFGRGLPGRRLGVAAWHRARIVRERLGRIFLVVLMARAMREFSDDDASHMGAGVAYYALFSLFPLLLGIIAVLGLVLDPDTFRDRLTDWAAEYLPGTGEFVTDIIDTAISQRGSLGILSIFGLLWSGSAIFGAINKTINRAWDIHKDRPFLPNKARQLAMALSVGVLFFLSLSTATVARIAERLREEDIPVLNLAQEAFGPLLFQGIAFLFTIAIFLVLYKVMPNTKTYWRYIWPGAVLAAFLFELAKNLFIVYLEQFASFSQVYGSIGPVIAVLLWAYVSALILIFGAEVSSEYGRLRLGVERGTTIASAENQPRREGPS